MENHNDKSKNIIIVLLIVMIIGLAGFICYDQFVVKKENEKPAAKKNEETTKEEIKQIVYSLDDPKISKLIDRLLVGVYNDHLEDFTNDKKVLAKDVSNLRAYDIAQYNEFYEDVEGKDGVSKLKKDKFTLEEMNLAIQKYLGKDYVFDPMSIDYKGDTCPNFRYDSKSKMFIFQETMCGGVTSAQTTYKLVNAVEEKGLLKLSIKVIFAGKEGYYSDYSKTKLIGDYSLEYTTLFDKGSNYLFIFNLTEGNYVFVSSEKI